MGNQEPHRICLHKGQQMVNMVLHFEPEFLWSYLGQNKDIRFLNVFFSHNQKFSNRLEKENPETQKIGTYLLEIEHEFIEKRPYYDLKIKVLMETIFLNILRNFDYFKSSGNSLEFSHKDIYRMAEVIHYIDLNIESPLTLQELSAIACVSPSYFSSLFKKYNGISLFQYIAQKRVEHAVSLMATTNLSLTEISSMCGFNNSTSFNKAFQRVMGDSPSAFRKKSDLLEQK